MLNKTANISTLTSALAKDSAMVGMVKMNNWDDETDRVYKTSHLWSAKPVIGHITVIVCGEVEVKEVKERRAVGIRMAHAKAAGKVGMVDPVFSSLLEKQMALLSCYMQKTASMVIVSGFFYGSSTQAGAFISLLSLVE
ncbi:unnamed protein product [Toxocara canis]|uniref:P-loop containing nucleoside triphosphatehydrolases superfamily protein n=1 Tax=Toxocara canis TaxID=6265 RepID=A0A183VA15_TOXCA|nr:unnamed protein product [Toxocara canis]